MDCSSFYPKRWTPSGFSIPRSTAAMAQRGEYTSLDAPLCSHSSKRHRFGFVSVLAGCLQAWKQSCSSADVSHSCALYLSLKPSVSWRLVVLLTPAFHSALNSCCLAVTAELSPSELSPSELVSVAQVTFEPHWITSCCFAGWGLFFFFLLEAGHCF